MKNHSITPPAMGGTSDPVDTMGANPRPTRGPLQGRSGSPAGYNTSGMEAALGALADKTHKPRR